MPVEPGIAMDMAMTMTYNDMACCMQIVIDGWSYNDFADGDCRAHHFSFFPAPQASATRRPMDQ
jgi:hypothetical protein